MRSSNARPLLWMLLGSLSFASMGALTYSLRDHCDWLHIALVRAGFMLVSALVMTWVGGVKLAFFRPGTLWMRSLAGTFALACTFYSMTRLPVADVLTLTNTYPIWIVVLSAVLLRLPPTVSEIAAILCGVAGVFLIQRPELGGDRLTMSIALMGSVATAIAMLGLHRLGALDPRAVIVHFATVSTLCVGLVALVRTPTLATEWGNLTVLAKMLGVGLLGTVGQVFLTKAYASGPPSRVAAVSLSQVVFAFAYDILIWHRRLGLIELLGFALILGPTAWLSIRAGRKLRQSRRTAPATAAERPAPATTPSQS